MEKQAGHGPVQNEILENRVLFSVFQVTDFGAVPGDGRDDAAAIQAAIDAAKPGDTVQFPAGAFDAKRTINVRGGRTIRGRKGASLGFQLDGKLAYGFALEPDARDVTIDRLDLRSSHGLIELADGSGYANITFANNRFEHHNTRDASGKMIFGIYASVRTDRLNIIGNHFHDSLDSARSWEVYYPSNARFDRNVFDKVYDGGHILEPGDNVSFSFNRGTKVARMGQEIQGHSRSRGMVVEGNVFSDWYKPWPDTFGLSVPANNLIEPVIRGNYLAATFDAASGWGPAERDGRRMNRFGIAIEAGGVNGIVEDNVIVGNWAIGVASTTVNQQVRNNQFYGKPIWGTWAAGEPGDRGFGGVVQTGSRVERDVSKAPRLPDIAPEPVDGDEPVDADDSASPAPSEGGQQYLSELEWVLGSNGWGDVERNMSNGDRESGDGAPLTIDGKTHEKGLGVAVDSEIIYDLDGKHTEFFSEVGIDDAVEHKGSMTFEVWADGVKKFDSGVMLGTDGAKPVRIDVTGVRELKLVTTNAGDGDNSDHGNWASARVT
jgi:hypothetical protein